MTEADAALLRLIETLKRRDYRFVTPTPATHARVVARPDLRVARDLADVLGWSLAFAPSLLDSEILGLLDAGGAIEPAGEGRLRSTLRVSWLRERLYLHSAYPTEAEDSVFFGPDSYRFADLIAAEAASAVPPGATIVDIGTGAGVGAIVAADLCPGASVAMTDVNAKALRLAAINARAAGFEIGAIQSDNLDDIDRPIDLALANPPYIVDHGERTYRDGGGMLGGEVSVEMARMAAARLASPGRLILYTGSAIVRGEDRLARALEALAAQHDCVLRYRELDPDVFGEELERPAYAEVERIAVVAAVFTKRAAPGR
jgi:hypothetical protein